MNPVTKFDTQWASRLADAYPEAAEQVEKLATHLMAKQERLFNLIQFCSAHPELDMMRMYVEYNAALDAVALEPPKGAEPEVSDEEAKALPHRQRAARTKRIRTRKAILKTAAELISAPSHWGRDELAFTAGVSVATLANYYATRNQLVAAAYEFLIDNG